MLIQGAKIQAGLDIISGLQEIYQIKMPIFIDNAEAVTHWMIDLNCQQIKLYADEKYKTLTFFANGEKQEGNMCYKTPLTNQELKSIGYRESMFNDYLYKFYGWQGFNLLVVIFHFNRFLFVILNRQLIFHRQLQSAMVLIRAFG